MSAVTITALPASRRARGSNARQRQITTPEGLTLSFTLASRGARFAALLVDLIIMAMAALALLLSLGFLAGGLNQLAKLSEGSKGSAIQFLFILLVAGLFLLRNAWFLWFELGPRGATPGKRLLGIRVAARGGQRLAADMIIARNLMRDVEVFVPIGALLTAMGTHDDATTTWLSAAWFALFAGFLLFNRDRLRAGDLIAGTWVIEHPKVALEASLAEQATPAPAGQGEYRFGPADLAIYGEFELQALEQVLRAGREEAMTAVASAICAKIGWSAPVGIYVRPFLEAYYTALRGRLESGMRFGQRKADKFT
jgi:uncharacterized RDD family membrane protein YckC